MRHRYSWNLETIERYSSMLLAMATAVLLGGLASACLDEQLVDDEDPSEQGQSEAETVDFERVMEEPGAFEGAITGETTVQTIVTDKSFLVGTEQEQLFVTFHKADESRTDLVVGQQVRIEGQLVGKEIAGDRVEGFSDQAKDKLGARQYALLVSDDDDVEILSQPPNAEAEEPPADGPRAVEFAEVIANPDHWANNWVRGEVTIDSLISDKAFFVSGEDDQRMMAAFRLEGESRADLQADQRVRLEGQIVSAEEALERLGQLDVPAPEQLEDESFALLVSAADDVEILSEAPTADAGGDQEQTMTEVGRRDYGTLQSWDVDGDGTVVREEFDKGVADKKVYTAIDTDGDGEVSRDEFQQWVFALWDGDDDGNVTEEEFEEKTEERWDDYEWGQFEEWNTDDDEMLTDTEFTAGATEVGVFEDWDADDDDALSEDEFADGLFDIWDENDDDALSDDEWWFEETEEEVSVR